VMNVPIAPEVPGPLMLVVADLSNPSVLPVKVIAPLVIVLYRWMYCALALENANPSSTVSQISQRFGFWC
jgi:hypothetical protein